jgi:glycosyl transferase family 25
MKSTPDIFLVNLDRSSDRLAFMQGQAERAGIAFERIPAVVGRNVPEWLVDEFSDSGKMSDGEVGCYASHLTVAQTIVARGLPYAIVLEDDAELDVDFIQAAVGAIAAASTKWDYIHLSSIFKRAVVQASDAEIGDGRTLVRYVHGPINTSAYVLSNRGARKWLAPTRRVRAIDLNNRYFWIQNLDVYGVCPAPARGLKVNTDIGARSPGRSFRLSIASRLYGDSLAMRRLGLSRWLKARSASIVMLARRKITGNRSVIIIG